MANTPLTTDTKSAARKKAEKRVKELKEFYEHVQSYILVNIVLILINWFTSSGFWWVRYVLFFWGIGLLFHAASVYWLNAGWWGTDWEDKKIEELTEKFSKDK